MVTVPLWLPEWPPEVFHWLLFTCVIGVERYLPLPAHIHPATAWRSLAAAMAAKVHRPAHTRSQQRISGLMAILTLLAPCLVIAALLMWMTDWKWLFSALTLYLCLGSQPSFSRQIESALKHGQKQLAREQLQPFVQRDCRTLSAVGIRKATAESTSRRLLILWLAPLVWFLLAGPIAVLAFRLLYELAAAWPVMRSKWHDFGFAAHEMLRAFTWPALWFGWLIPGFHQILRGRLLPWTMPSTPYLHRQDGIWWRALSLVTHTRLGGPVVLNSKRCERPYFNSSTHEMDATDAKRFQRYTSLWQLIVWLLISLLFLTGVVHL